MNAKPRWETDGANWPHREASRFIEAGGVRWHVQVYGSGPAILFLHGAGAASHSWADVGAALERDFTIVAVDLPGHGFTSTPPDARMSLAGMTAATSALLTALNVEPDLIVGHSAGAAIMIELIAEKLVTPRAGLSINGALAPFDGPASFLFPAMAKLLSLNPFAPSILAHGAARRDRVEQLIKGTGSAIQQRNIALYAALLARPGHVAGVLRMMANWNVEGLRRKLSRLETPVFFAAAEKDRAVPPALAAEAARLAPKGALRSFPALGHLAHEENPVAFATLIREIVAAH
ncbi:MAG: alpha/beta fold hydrolase BchO [Parvularculaceae bacterium]|nr:alpha/beta fold hydrolase BchO [Parvularculaceae bacterium]